MGDWSTTPIDVRDETVRRVFGQELVTRMARVGSATLDELAALPLLLFKVPAKRDELGQIAQVARRLGWLEPPADDTGEWKLTDAGRAVRPPPTLAATQVVTRIFSLANPVRAQAKDWVPLLAVAAGAAATATKDTGATADIVRVLAIAVLAGSIAWQFYGELQLARAVRAWARIHGQAKLAPATSLYRAPRLMLAVVFDLALLATFGLAIFGAAAWWVAAALACAGGIVHLFAWTLPAAVMVQESRGMPIRSRVLRWITSEKRWFTPKPVRSPRDRKRLTRPPRRTAVGAFAATARPPGCSSTPWSRPRR